MIDSVGLSDLSMREIEVLREIAQLKTNKQVAQTLEICEKTVEFHTRNIYYKLKVKNRIEVILWFTEYNKS